MVVNKIVQSAWRSERHRRTRGIVKRVKEPKSMALKAQTGVTAVPWRLSEAEVTPVPSVFKAKLGGGGASL